MSPRFYKRCLVWLLPLLVVQSLVPVGFMFAAGTAGFSVEFCPVQSARVVAALGSFAHDVVDHSDHQAHSSHHLGAGSEAAANDEHHSSSHAAQSNACPFALVASAIASVPATSLAAVTLFEVTRSLPSQYRPPAESVRLAANRVRGPPQLSS